MLDPYTINDRIWEELGERVFALGSPFYLEELNRLADADDLDGAFEMLKELREVRI